MDNTNYNVINSHTINEQIIDENVLNIIANVNQNFEFISKNYLINNNIESKEDNNHTSNNNLNKQTRALSTHSKKLFECNKCDYKAYKKLAIDLHNRCVHLRENAYRCDVNGCEERRFVSRTELRNHKTCAHSDQRKFDAMGNTYYCCYFKGCEQKRFSSQAELSSHRLSVHNDEPQFVCDWPQCGYAFKLRRNLTKHLKFCHTPDKDNLNNNYIESIVENNYNSDNVLNEHIRQTHCEKSFKSAKCDYKTSAKHDLDVHNRRIHLREKTHCCVVKGCEQKTFFGGSALYLPYCCEKCEIKCHNRHKYTAKKKINANDNINQNDRQFECDECERKYDTEDHLNCHKRMVHFGTLFKCYRCDYKAYHKTSVDQHNRVVHLREKKYSAEKEITITENINQNFEYVSTNYLKNNKNLIELQNVNPNDIILQLIQPEETNELFECEQCLQLIRIEERDSHDCGEHHTSINTITHNNNSVTEYIVDNSHQNTQTLFKCENLIDDKVCGKVLNSLYDLNDHILNIHCNDKTPFKRLLDSDLSEDINKDNETIISDCIEPIIEENESLKCDNYNDLKDNNQVIEDYDTNEQNTANNNQTINEENVNITENKNQEFEYLSKKYLIINKIDSIVGDN